MITAAIAPLDPAALKASELALERDAQEASTLVITSQAMFEAVGEVLIEKLKEKDAAQAFADKYTKPAYRNWQDLLDLFRPTTKAYEAIEKALKRALGEWELKLEAEKIEARADARAALESGNVAAMTEALTIANAPEVSAQGVSSRKVWRVKRYNKDAMDPEYLIPDEKKCEAVARAHRGDEPPFIRGVVFELDVRITGRRA